MLIPIIFFIYLFFSQTSAQNPNLIISAQGLRSLMKLRCFNSIFRVLEVGSGQQGLDQYNE